MRRGPTASATPKRVQGTTKGEHVQRQVRQLLRHEDTSAEFGATRLAQEFGATTRQWLKIGAQGERWRELESACRSKTTRHRTPGDVFDFRFPTFRSVECPC